MNRQFLLMGVCVAAVSLPLSAEVYQWVDELGKKHYSDRPHLQAKKIKLNPGYTFHRIRHVFDGDTVQLENGQKVRFLGINTPEVEGHNKLAQSGGLAAKQWLAAKLKAKTVRLETDVEKKDKYGRLLAHLFLPEGEHVNVQLVSKGLATVNIHPPNLKYTQQLIAAQDSAEQKKLGIWRDPSYASQPYQNLTDYRGWHRITGTVNRVKQSRKYVYLQFSEDFSIGIKRRALNLFAELSSFLRRNVEVRGWIRKSGKGHVMFIRHPADIKMLP
jgi:endonuclease YncB( thermonuclease family)